MTDRLYEEVKGFFTADEKRGKQKQRVKAQQRIQAALGILNELKRNEKYPEKESVPVIEALSKYGKKKERTMESIKTETQKRVMVELSEETQLIYEPRSRHFFIVEDGKWWVLDSGYHTAVPPSYEHLNFFEGYDYSSNLITKLPLFIFESNKKKGLVSADGTVILPASYDTIEQFYTEEKGDLVRLTQDGKEGMASLEYKEWAYSLNHLIEPFAEKVYGKDSWYLFWKKGTKKMASHMKDFSKEFEVSDDGDDGRYLVEFRLKKIIRYLDNKRQLSSYGEWRGDITGNEKLGREKEIEKIDERNGPYLKYKKNGKYGVSKYGMKEILPADYDEIEGRGAGGNLTFTHQKNGKRGATGYDKKVLVTDQYDAIRHIPFSEGFYVQKEGKRTVWHMGYSNGGQDGKTTYRHNKDAHVDEIIDLTYQHSEKTRLPSEFNVVRNGSKYGITDIFLNEIIPSVYNRISYEHKKTPHRDIDLFVVENGGLTETICITLGSNRGEYHIIHDYNPDIPDQPTVEINF